jgi:hypothetical protein
MTNVYKHTVKRFSTNFQAALVMLLLNLGLLYLLPLVPAAANGTCDVNITFNAANSSAGVIGTTSDNMTTCAGGRRLQATYIYTPPA